MLQFYITINLPFENWESCSFGKLVGCMNQIIMHDRILSKHDTHCMRHLVYIFNMPKIYSRLPQMVVLSLNCISQHCSIVCDNIIVHIKTQSKWIRIKFIHSIQWSRLIQFRFFFQNSRQYFELVLRDWRWPVNYLLPLNLEYLSLINSWMHKIYSLWALIHIYLCWNILFVFGRLGLGMIQEIWIHMFVAYICNMYV